MTSRSSFHRHSFSGSPASSSHGGIVAPRPSRVAAQAATALIGKLHDLAQDTLNKPATQKILNRIPSPVANIFKDDPDTGPSVLDHFAGLLPQKLADNLIGLQGITRILASIVRTMAAILSWRRPHIERLIKEAQRSGDGRQVSYFSPHPPPVAVLAMTLWTFVCFHPVFLLASLPLWIVALCPTAPTDLRTPRTPGSGTLRRHGMNRVSADDGDDGTSEISSESDNEDELIIPPPQQPLCPPALPSRSQSVSRSSSQDAVDQATKSIHSQPQEPALAPPPLPPRPSEPVLPSAPSGSANDSLFVIPLPRTTSTNSSHSIPPFSTSANHIRSTSHQSLQLQLPVPASSSSSFSFSTSSATLDPSFDASWSARPPTANPSPVPTSDCSASPSKRATKGPTTQAVHDLLEIQSIILSSADRVRQLLAILGFDNSITRWASTVAKLPPEDMPALNSKKSLTERELIGQGVPLAVSVGALCAWLGVVCTGWVVPAVWAAGILAMVVFSDLGLFYMALLVPLVMERVEACVRAASGWWIAVRARWAAPGHAVGYEPPKTSVGKLAHALVMECGAVARAVSVSWAYRMLFWWANLVFDVRRAVVGREACPVVDDDEEEEQRRLLFLDEDEGSVNGEAGGVDAAGPKAQEEVQATVTVTRVSA